MNNWSRGKLSDLYRRTAVEISYYTKITALRMLPVFLMYALAIIGMLKLSQIVLGWSF